jgi:hypothetical protein
MCAVPKNLGSISRVSSGACFTAAYLARLSLYIYLSFFPNNLFTQILSELERARPDADPE